MNIKYICADCGIKAVKFCGVKARDQESTFHNGKCEVCEKETGVTNTRNYSHLYVNKYVEHLDKIAEEGIEVMNGSHNSNINEELENE